MSRRRYAPSEAFKDPAVERELRRISEAFETVNRLPVLHTAPLKPRDGDVVICDGTDWDPLSDGTKRPLWYDADVPEWKAFL